MHTDDDLDAEEDDLDAEEDDLDAELVELLRRAAAEIPGYPGNRAALARRRAARHRRHLAVAMAAGVTVTILAGGVALFGADNRAPTPEVAAKRPAASRLFLAPGGFSWEGTDGRQVGLSPDDLGEVLPDGRLVPRPVSGLVTVIQAATLPDGGFVALGLRTPTGPHSVAVVRPDGSVRLLRDTAGTVLLGADDRRVYLWGGGPVALDLATGRQQSLPWPALAANAVLAGGRFAELTGDPTASPPQPCGLRLLDAGTGAQISTRPLPSGDCWRAAMALSPDGRWLAIAQPGPLIGGNVNELRLVLLDVDTGERTSQVLDEGPAAGDSGNVTFQGMAWLNDEGVRVVWTHLPDHVDRMYDRSEVLRTRTVTVPGK